MMGPRETVSGVSFVVLYLVGWFLSGVPIQRGPTGVAFYIGFIGALWLGFFISDMMPTWKKEEPAPEPIDVGTGVEPLSDKTKMREAVLQGVLEAIKGLVVRSENGERELKELKNRVSELSLAAGLKPRVARAPAEPRT